MKEITDEKWQTIVFILDKLHETFNEIYKLCDELNISPESKFFSIHNNTIENVINLIVYYIDENEVEYIKSTIDWFIYECDFGRNPNEAGCKDNLKLIDSYDKLRWLLELNCNND